MVAVAFDGDGNNAFLFMAVVVILAAVVLYDGGVGRWQRS